DDGQQGRVLVRGVLQLAEYGADLVRQGLVCRVQGFLRAARGAHESVCVAQAERVFLPGGDGLLGEAERVDLAELETQQVLALGPLTVRAADLGELRVCRDEAGMFTADDLPRVGQVREGIQKAEVGRRVYQGVVGVLGADVHHPRREA